MGIRMLSKKTLRKTCSFTRRELKDKEMTWDWDFNTGHPVSVELILPWLRPRSKYHASPVVYLRASSVLRNTLRIVGQIVLNCLGSQASKTELSDLDSSPQILMFWRFINFEVTPCILFIREWESFQCRITKTWRRCELFFAEGCNFSPCLCKGYIYTNAPLVKLLTNAFTHSQILEARVTLGNQSFCLNVALCRKRIKTLKHLHLILSL